jgi:hypothetical protein
MITRRELLVTTGAVSLVGSLEILREAPLKFVDGLLSADELAMGKRALGTSTPDVLQLDLVREWRDQLHSRVAQGTGFVAVTRWDKSFLLRDLARESAFVVRQERIAPSLFRTEIALRS